MICGEKLKINLLLKQLFMRLKSAFLSRAMLLLIFLVVFSNTIFATNYYVSMTGNDSNSGLTTDKPWKTLRKVNTTVFSPGDMILFKRGDRFYGSLIPTSSGNSTRLITYGAYGTGVKPMISSFERLTGWVSAGNGVYSAKTTAKNPQIVSLNGVNVGMGRYPKSGWLTFESFVGLTSITDNELTSTPNWTGGEVVIKKSNWLIDRNLITNHSGSVINYTSASTWTPRTDGEYQFFIQNHRAALTQKGDWYYSNGLFYMYFGTTDPNTSYVKVPWSDYLVNINRKSYVVIDNIFFEGANKRGVLTYQSVDVRITNCDFSFMGDNAVYSTSSQKTLVDNCTVKSCNGTCIYINAINSIIRNNVLTDIGLIPGMGNSSGDTYNGISLRGTGSICEYNTLKNIGYNGIMFFSDNSIVRYNLVDGFCKFLFDGGAIYTYYGGSPTYIQRGMKIYGNIVMNGGGNGLYSDGLTNNLEIYNNGVANVEKWGVHMNQPRSNKVYNNNFINCGRCGMDISNLYNQEVIASLNSLYSNTVAQGNTTQLMMYLTDNREYNVAKFGTSNSNSFIAGADGLNLFRQQVGLPRGKNTFYTYPAWKLFSLQELNSKLLITNLADIRFEYNASKTSKVISLSSPMIDAKGTKYSTSITLLPYTSIILMKDAILKSGSIPTDQNYATTAVAADIPVIDDEQVVVSLYPNPAKGSVVVRFSKVPAVGSRIDILDMAGRTVATRLVSESAETFDLSNQQSGLYLVKTIIGSVETIQKLIVNK